MSNTNMTMHSQNSHFSAYTTVLGTSPLNSTAPDTLGRNNPSCWGSCITSVTKGANWFSVGQRIGQKGAEGQQGTINVP